MAQSWQSLFSPGRVNLVGEHLDYHGGPVLPMAIDRGIRLRFRPRTDGLVVLASEGHPSPEPFAAAEPPAPGQRADWSAAAAGALALSREAPGPGLDLHLASDLPTGSGLSSSAALITGLIRAVRTLDGAPLSPAEVAGRAQAVEHRWLGVACGIMDPWVIAHAADPAMAGRAMRLDCAVPEHRAVPAEIPGTRWVVLDTRAPRTLAGSAYNARRAAGEAAARTLGLPRLAALPAEALHDALARLDDPEHRRLLRHVVTESARVDALEAALRAGDAAAAGRVLDASHASLRDDYRVSSPELDAITDAARAHPACFGARMTGAGFGGCALALVEAGAWTGPSAEGHGPAGADFAACVAEGYRAAAGREAAVFPVRPFAGPSRSREGATW